MKIYEKCSAEPYPFLVNDTTLPPSNTLPFRKNLLEQIYNKIIKINDQIKDGKLQYDRNTEALSVYHHAKFIIINNSQLKKYCILVKSK